MVTILEAMVGSKAYGLDHAGSDEDFLAVHVAPTLDLVGYHKPSDETVRSDNPDRVSHEVGKFVRLAAQGNPTVNELLWLDHYEIVDQAYGAGLLNLRKAFLSQRVRATYLGYANQQFKKFEEKGRFNKVPVSRLEKHARHLLRLTEQGTKLWLTGQLEPRPDDPAGLHAQAAHIATKDDGAQVALNVIADAAKVFDGPTPLPPEPDELLIADYLRRTRYMFIL